jgi:hypothetical protein
MLVEHACGALVPEGSNTSIVDRYAVAGSAIGMTRALGRLNFLHDGFPNFFNDGHRCVAILRFAVIC